jgi:hypothetical protein
MKFAEFIKWNVWLNIEDKFISLYPDQQKNIIAYDKVFNELKILQPENSELTINLIWVRDDFDEEEYVDVSGYLANQEATSDETTVSYALDFTPWEEWLGMDIDDKSIQAFSEPEIISHCLYEMTFYGFTQEKIQKEWKKIEKSVEDLENMTEEEKKKHIKSWEDLKKELDIEDEKNESDN